MSVYLYKFVHVWDNVSDLVYVSMRVIYMILLCDFSA